MLRMAQFSRRAYTPQAAATSELTSGLVAVTLPVRQVGGRYFEAISRDCALPDTPPVERLGSRPQARSRGSATISSARTRRPCAWCSAPCWAGAPS
jgi:hypothetical protein